MDEKEDKEQVDDSEALKSTSNFAKRRNVDESLQITES